DELPRRLRATRCARLVLGAANTSWRRRVAARPVFTLDLGLPPAAPVGTTGHLLGIRGDRQHLGRAGDDPRRRWIACGAGRTASARLVGVAPPLLIDMVGRLWLGARPAAAVVWVGVEDDVGLGLGLGLGIQ